MEFQVWLSEQVSRLSISRDAMEKAASLLGGDKMAGRIRKEWLNVLLGMAGDQHYDREASDPDASFLRWAEWRAAHPYDLTYREVDAATKKYGSDVSVVMKMRWGQEIAWAWRMRFGDNGRVAVLGALFMDTAKKRLSDVFDGLTQVYIATLSSDSAYASNRNHTLSPDEIVAGVGDDVWTPLFVRYADREFGQMINSMPEIKFQALVGKVRSDAEAELRAAATQGQIEAAKKRSFSRMIGSIVYADDRGLGPSELHELERGFMQAMSEGRIASVGSKATERLFLEYIDGNRTFRVRPEDDDVAVLKRKASKLSGKWLEDMPEDLTFGGLHASHFDGWKKEIAAGRRTPAADLYLDFAFYILKRTQDAS